MAQVKNPFGPGKVSTSDPTGSVKSIIMGVAGFALLWVILQYGIMAGGRVTEITDGLLGTNASGSAGVSFDGAP